MKSRYTHGKYKFLIIIIILFKFGLNQTWAIFVGLLANSKKIWDVWDTLFNI